MNDPLVGEKTVAMSIAQDILTSRSDIPAIPENVRHILKMVRLPEKKIDIPEFAHLVEADPGMFTRILQLANSPYYCGVEKIVSLRSAIMRIGLKETVNAVCLEFFQKSLPTFPGMEGCSYNDFWAFSWACAAAVKRLGHPALGFDTVPGDLYMAGMLQGLGKLLFAIHFPDEFRKCVSKARQMNCATAEIEKDKFGTTASLVGARVLETWNLPDKVIQAVAFCHIPHLAEPEYRSCAAQVQFAYAIAGKCGIGASGDGTIPEFSDTYFGKNGESKLSEPGVQEALLEEISSVLKAKAGSIFPNTGTDQNNTGRSEKEPAGQKKIQIKNSVITHPDKDKKNGFINWVISFFKKG